MLVRLDKIEMSHEFIQGIKGKHNNKKENNIFVHNSRIIYSP